MSEVFVADNIQKYETDPSHYSWAIIRDAQIIGYVGVYDIDDYTQSGEIGITVASAFSGHGYASEAIHAVLEYMLGKVGLNRVFAWCNARNIGSSKAMQKAGMTYEGTAREAAMRSDGEHDDVLWYSILKSD